MSYQNMFNDYNYFYQKYLEPVFFGNIVRPQFWPVIVTALIIFLTISEIGSQSCADGNCGHFRSVNAPNNENKKLTSNYIDGLISRIKLNHTVVGWRRSLILAIILSLIILLPYNDGLPDGLDFFLIATILFLIIYFVSSWFQWHWWKARDHEMEDELLLLRDDIKKREIKKDISKKDNYYGDFSVMSHIESILY